MSDVYCKSCSVVVSSLFAVLKRGVRHHRRVRQEDRQHADVILRCTTRLLCDAQLPHGKLQPVCHPAETRTAGCPGGRYRALQVVQVRLHVQLGLW